MPHLSRFFLNMRSRLKSRVSALNGSPSWKRTPGRRRELPGGVAHRLPRHGQARHRAPLGIRVDEALEHLPDIGRSHRAHAEPRVHVLGVVGHGDDQLGLGVDRLGPGLRAEQARGEQTAEEGKAVAVTIRRVMASSFRWQARSLIA